MAYGSLPANFDSMNEAQKNDATRAAGYTGLSDYQNNRGNTQSSGGGFSSSGGGTGWEDIVKRTIEMQKQANQPTIASYQAQIPEIQSQYAAQTANVTAKAQTLKDRYDNLLKSIGTQKTQDINKQTLVTSNELGKRGLLPSSTLAQQEVLNATQPIGERYAGLETTAALDQTSGQQELQALLNQLTSGETSDKRAVLNAIAQLESGATTQGMTLGSNLYGSEQTRLANEAAAKYKAQQDAIANQIAQGQLANQTAQTQYDINKPYSTASGDIDLGDGTVTGLQWLNAQGKPWTDTKKVPVTKLPNGQMLYSDGSKGWTQWTQQ